MFDGGEGQVCAVRTEGGQRMAGDEGTTVEDEVSNGGGSGRYG